MKQKPQRRRRKHTTATKAKLTKGVNRFVKREDKPWLVRGESLSVKAKTERNNI